MTSGSEAGLNWLGDITATKRVRRAHGHNDGDHRGQMMGAEALGCHPALLYTTPSRISKPGFDSVDQRQRNLLQGCVLDVVNGAFTSNKAPKPPHFAALLYVQ